jgi:hypothetical protein
MSDSKTSSGGVGFFGLLGIAFIVLKLCNVIAWSWWWVTCPLWGPISLVIIGYLIYLPFKVWGDKDKRDRIMAGYNEIGWKKEGKSKWQQRMEEIQKKQKSTSN